MVWKREIQTALQAKPSPRGCPSPPGMGKRQEEGEPGGEAVSAKSLPKEVPEAAREFSQGPGAPALILFL